MILLNSENLKRIINPEKDYKHGIYIDPILDDKQIKDVCVDLRLDCNFYVPIVNEKSKITIKDENDLINKYFQKTYRKLGSTFVLYPGQFVLANSLEYIRLPKNVFAEVILRSSYNRLGLFLSSIVQPGYSGTLTLEIKNLNTMPIELVIGSRIVQIRFFYDDNKKDYSVEDRAKYICPIEPELSKCFSDSDIKILDKISKLD